MEVTLVGLSLEAETSVMRDVQATSHLPKLYRRAMTWHLLILLLDRRRVDEICRSLETLRSNSWQHQQPKEAWYEHSITNLLTPYILFPSSWETRNEQSCNIASSQCFKGHRNSHWLQPLGSTATLPKKIDELRLIIDLSYLNKLQQPIRESRLLRTLCLKDRI